MKCNRFALIIMAFLAWLGTQTNNLPKDVSQQVIPLIPANYGMYSEALIQHIIEANAAGAGDITSADFLRSNMAQYAALAAGAEASIFFDINGATLYDITQQPYPPGSEEATLWDELKGLWFTINQTFTAANPVGKILSLMQMIGILKCVKWCIDAACNMVSGAYNFGTMSIALFKNWISKSSFDITKTSLLLQNKVTILIEDLDKKNSDELINLNLVDPAVLKLLIENPVKPIRDLLAYRYIQPESTQEEREQKSTDLSYVNPLTGESYGGKKTKSKKPRTKSKRRPYKSKRRRSSKKRRHYKTKKRAYRSTRFRTHR